MKPDSEKYLQQKKFLRQLLTIFGRKPILEAINDTSLDIHRIHISDSNKPSDIIKEIEKKAQLRNIEICYHSKQALSRISKNSKQDQGIAADIRLKGFIDFDQFLNKPSRSNFSLIALDNVTNPQNVGMIIRSVCASASDGLIIPEKGCAKLDSLVIKASAGTLFKAPIIRSSSLHESLVAAKKKGVDIVGLDVSAKQELRDLDSSTPKIYVLGNETDGLSKQTHMLCNKHISIKMHNEVESLNVAVTASLIAFYGAL